MGTDIHTIVQIRKNGKWVEHLNLDQEEETPVGLEPLDDRNYKLFGLLAGVRGAENPIKEPCGFPCDCGRGKWISELSLCERCLERIFQWDYCRECYGDDFWGRFYGEHSFTHYGLLELYNYQGWPGLKEEFPEAYREFHERTLPALSDIARGHADLGDDENLRILVGFDS